LAIHAACAKVTHFPGAGEYIRKILRCMEDTRVLAEDGGSAELLLMAMLSWRHRLSIQSEGYTHIDVCM
ncbi:hypothetical protein EDD17DRAFT_1484153, partial [Pisolithus thermaeus]